MGPSDVFNPFGVGKNVSEYLWFLGRTKNNRKAYNPIQSVFSWMHHRSTTLDLKWELRFITCETSDDSSFNLESIGNDND